MLALFALLPLLASPVAAWASDNHTCAILPQYYSCELDAAALKSYDTCCTPTQGLVLVTQFWNTYLQPEGEKLPKDSWTIHGLWPDKCDGTYGQYCDLARQWDPKPSPKTVSGLPNGTVVPPWEGGDVISDILQRHGKWDLLAYMKKFWKSLYDPDWVFWAHEYSKHATCFTTFDVGNDGSPDCYGSEYANATEASVIEFFEAAVRHDLKYPTYKWLADDGIVPSNSTGYKLQKFEKALGKASGATPYVGCGGANKDVIVEVWYFAHSLGRPQDSVLKPVEKIGKSNCNATTDLWYYERTEGFERK